MFDFTLEWTEPGAGISRAAEARRITQSVRVRETVVLPLLLLLGFLLCLGIMTGEHLRGSQDRAALSFAVSGMGFPVIAAQQDSCRVLAGPSSAQRLRASDLTALLTSR